MKSQWVAISSDLGLKCTECANAAQLARVTVVNEQESRVTGTRCNGHGEPSMDYLRNVWQEKMEPYTKKPQYLF